MHKKSLEAQDTLNGSETGPKNGEDEEEKVSKKLSSSMESLNVVSPTPSPSGNDYNGYSGGFSNTEAFR